MRAVFFDIRLVKTDRRMVETDIVDKTKLSGAIVEMSDRYVIAKNVLRPSKPQRRGRNLDFGFEYFLVVVVARTQHHPVLSKSDWLIDNGMSLRV